MKALKSEEPTFRLDENYSSSPTSSFDEDKSKGLKTSEINFKFREEFPDPKIRRKQCKIIRKKYPDKIPIIIEKNSNSNISNIDKTKYLIPLDLTVSQFSYMIRKRIKLSNESAFFLLVNGKISITGDSLLSDIYERYQDPEDSFLYITYSSELTWGNI